MSKHSPARLHTYLHTHEAVLENFRKEGFVCCDNLSIEQFHDSLVMSGEICCLGGIVISVFKTMRFVTDDTVQTVGYSYNVRLYHGNNLFRYDNAHEHEGHQDAHHKDLYNPKTGERLPSKWIGEARWPTLGEVIREAQEWSVQHSEFLESPHECLEDITLSDPSSRRNSAGPE